MGDIIEPADGHEPDDEEIPGRRPMPFFPDFALVEAITALAFLTVLLLVASLTKPTLEEAADPTASGYVPRPEWYFLWVFQALKYFKGSSEVIGTFAFPAVAIGLLLALPFIDRRERRVRPLLPHTRPVRLWPRVGAAMTFAVIGTLTLSAVRSPNPMTEASHLSAAEEAGMAMYDKLGCSSCHLIGDVGGDRGPELTSFGGKPDAGERVLLHFGGIGQEPDSAMPGYQLSESELRSLAAYLLSLEGKG